MDHIITIMPVVTKDLPISPRFTPYDFFIAMQVQHSYNSSTNGWILLSHDNPVFGNGPHHVMMAAHYSEPTGIQIATNTYPVQPTENIGNIYPTRYLTVWFHCFRKAYIRPRLFLCSARRVLLASGWPNPSSLTSVIPNCGSYLARNYPF